MDSSSKKKQNESNSDSGRGSVFPDNKDNNKRAWLEAILIENFQAHEETKIRLDPGVNVFIGKSDSGKSAILRAIKWNLLNIPNGSSFCSFWADNSRVKTKINGSFVERIRTKSKNIYNLNNKEFSAFGNGVPAEILETHLVQENNIQNQMDTPFLLSQSSGEVARLCNKAVNLELIDSVGKNLRSKLFETRQNKTFHTSALEESKLKIKKFKNLEKMKSLLYEAGLLQKEVDSCYHFYNQIKEKLEVIKENTPLVRQLEKNETKLKIILDIEKKYLNFQNKKQEKDRILCCINKIEDCLREAKKYKNLSQKEELIKQIEEKEALISKITKEREEINKALENLNMHMLSYSKIKNEVEKQEAYLKENSPATCPLCGSELKGKTLLV